MSIEPSGRFRNSLSLFAFVTQANTSLFFYPLWTQEKMVFKYLFSSVALPPNQHMWVCKTLCVHLVWILTAKQAYIVDRLNTRDLAANQALLNSDFTDQNINTNVSWWYVTQKLQMSRNMFVRLPFKLSQNDFHICAIFQRQFYSKFIQVKGVQKFRVTT